MLQNHQIQIDLGWNFHLSMELRRSYDMSKPPCRAQRIAARSNPHGSFELMGLLKREISTLEMPDFRGGHNATYFILTAAKHFCQVWLLATLTLILGSTELRTMGCGQSP